VLALSFAANATVALRGALPYGAAYACLFAALAASFAVDPAQVLGRGALWSLAFGLLLLTPIFFAGTVFSRSFASTRAAGAALGFNMLGSALGGWLEYATMATGIRSLALLAGALYLGSLFCLVASRRTPSAR